MTSLVADARPVLFYRSPVITIGIAQKENAVSHIFFGGSLPSSRFIEQETPLLREAANQLAAYFAGKLRAFDLPLSPEGTAFQQSVWQALLTIPYGETRTYADIARQIGNEKACRAVGGANNKNPIAIVIPCHRVIGANGALTGYAGGLSVKEHLLRLEGIL